MTETTIDGVDMVTAPIAAVGGAGNIDPEVRRANQARALAAEHAKRAEVAKATMAADKAKVETALDAARGAVNTVATIAAATGLSGSRVGQVVDALVAEGRAAISALSDEEKAAFNAGKRGRKPTNKIALV